MKFAKHRATRNSPNSHHASYGIYKWLISKGIKDESIQESLVDNFCNQNGYEETGKRNGKLYFVQNRFSKFCSWVGNQQTI